MIQFLSAENEMRAYEEQQEKSKLNKDPAPQPPTTRPYSPKSYIRT